MEKTVNSFNGWLISILCHRSLIQTLMKINLYFIEQQCSDFVFKFKREISNALVSVGKAPPVNLFPKETQPIRRTPIDVRASSEFQIVDVNSLIKKSSPIATIPTLKGRHS